MGTQIHGYQSNVNLGTPRDSSYRKNHLSFRSACAENNISLARGIQSLMKEMFEQGTYGTIVFHGNTAIKTFTSVRVFYKELFYLSLLRRYGVSKILSASAPDLTITMEKYDGSLVNLMSLLGYESRLYLAGKIIRQILPVINNIHSHGIAHKDISVANIFFRQDFDSMGVYEFYLGDFSLSSVFNEVNYHKQRHPQAPHLINLYSDPDIRATMQQTDIWMFGVAIWEFISKDRFVVSFTNGLFLDYRKVFANDGVSHYITEDIYTALCRMLKYNAAERDTMCITMPIYQHIPLTTPEEWEGDSKLTIYPHIRPKLVENGVDPELAAIVCDNAMCDISHDIYRYNHVDVTPIIDTLVSVEIPFFDS